MFEKDLCTGKKTAIAKRKHFWKKLLYLKEERNQIEIKTTFEKDFCT